MFKQLRDWYGRTRERQSENQVVASGDAINQATQVSVSELIGLRRYASQVDISRLIASRANRFGGEVSRFRGRGMDYQESRVYQPGDDIRNMDWRVTARAGRPHVKVYEEERERPVLFLVDFNSRMFFASRGSLKSVVAARIVALLAWVTADRGDRIGAIVMGTKDDELRPAQGKSAVLALLRQLVHHSDPRSGLDRVENPSRLTAALTRLSHIVRPGSLVFIVSDLYDFDDESGPVLGRLSQHADIVVVCPVDPLERVPPPADSYAVTNGVDTRMLDISSRTESGAYIDYFRSHEERISQALRRYRIALVEVGTGDDVVRVLVKGARTTQSPLTQVSAAHNSAEIRA